MANARLRSVAVGAVALLEALPRPTIGVPKASLTEKPTTGGLAIVTPVTVTSASSLAQASDVGRDGGLVGGGVAEDRHRATGICAGRPRRGRLGQQVLERPAAPAGPGSPSSPPQPARASSAIMDVATRPRHGRRIFLPCQPLPSFGATDDGPVLHQIRPPRNLTRRLPSDPIYRSACSPHPANDAIARGRAIWARLEVNQGQPIPGLGLGIHARENLAPCQTDRRNGDDRARVGR